MNRTKARPASDAEGRREKTTWFAGGQIDAQPKLAVLGRLAYLNGYAVNAAVKAGDVRATFHSYVDGLSASTPPPGTC